jgi:hypothetical protein
MKVVVVQFPSGTKFLFSKASRWALRPTQPPAQSVRGIFLQRMAAGALSSPSLKMRRVILHSPLRLLGEMPSYKYGRLYPPHYC